MIKCFNSHNQVLGAIDDVRSGLPTTLLKRKKGSDSIERECKVYGNNRAATSGDDYSAHPMFQGSGGDKLYVSASEDPGRYLNTTNYAGMPLAKRDATTQFLLAAATTNLFITSSIKEKRLQIFKHLYCYFCNNDAPPWQLNMPDYEIKDWLADVPEQRTRLVVGYFGPSGIIPSTSNTFSKQSKETVHVGFPVFSDRNTLSFSAPTPTEIKRIKSVCHANLQEFLSYLDVEIPLQATVGAINEFMAIEVPTQLVKLALDKIYSSEGKDWSVLHMEDLFRRKIIANEDIEQQKNDGDTKSAFVKAGDEIPMSSPFFLFLDKMTVTPTHDIAFSPLLGTRKEGVFNLCVSYDEKASSKLSVRFGGAREYMIARYITRMLNCHLIHGACVKQTFVHKGSCFSSSYERKEVAVVYNALPTDECVKCNKSRENNKYFGEPIGTACCSLGYESGEADSNHTLYSTTGVSSWQLDDLSVPDPKIAPDGKTILFFDTNFTKIASDKFDASAILEDAGLAYRITENAIVGGVGITRTFGLPEVVPDTEKTISGIPYILPGLEIAKLVEKWGEGEQKLFVLLASLLQARGLSHWYRKVINQVLLRDNVVPTLINGIYTIPDPGENASPVTINALNACVQQDILSNAEIKFVDMPSSFAPPIYKEEHARPAKSDPANYLVFDLNKADPVSESTIVVDNEQFTPSSYAVDVKGPIVYSKQDVQLRGEILISSLPEDAVAHLKKALKLLRNTNIGDDDAEVYKLLKCAQEPFTAEEIEKLGWAHYHYKSLGFGPLMKTEHPEEFSWLNEEMAISAKIATWYEPIRDAATPTDFATVDIFSFTGGLVNWQTLKESLVFNLNRLRLLANMEIRTILASYNDTEGDPPPERESALWWAVPIVSQTIGEILSTKSILGKQCK